RVEATQPLDDGLVFGDLGVARDDERERFLHPTKRRGDLHQPAELDLLGEIARRRNQERKYRRHLLVAVGEPAQLLAPKNDVPPIRDNISEALVEDLSLSPLTAIEGDAFGIFTQPHQAETK